jgi:hypothetical protein
LPAAVPCRDPGRGPRSSPCARGSHGIRDRLRDENSFLPFWPDIPDAPYIISVGKNGDQGKKVLIRKYGAGLVREA